MRYLIFHKGSVFCTKWFCEENHYTPGMVVVDLIEGQYFRGTDEGWIDIEIDHL